MKNATIIQANLQGVKRSDGRASEWVQVVDDSLQLYEIEERILEILWLAHENATGKTLSDEDPKWHYMHELAEKIAGTYY